MFETERETTHKRQDITISAWGGMRATAMSRSFSVALAGAVLCVTLAAPASALCRLMPLESAVRQADTVWWGTVTETEPGECGQPGIWTMTVRLDDVLKGHGMEGGSGTVLFSSVVRL